MEAQKTITIPTEVSSLLLEILAKDERANLILRGFASGKELTGKIALKGTFTLEIE